MKQKFPKILNKTDIFYLSHENVRSVILIIVNFLQNSKMKEIYSFKHKFMQKPITELKR